MTTDTAAGGTTTEHKRATVRPDKAEAVAEITEAFRSASAAVLTEYRGLSVKQITALRVALGPTTSYSVVKNTLTSIAAGEAGVEGLDELLSGPTAVAFVTGDPVEAAKSLRDFARTNPQLVVKGGVMEGRALTADDVRKLADLESREVLLAKLAGALLASLSQAVYLFNAPLQQVARLAGALQQKATEDPSVIGGAGTAAATVDERVDAAVEAEAAAPPADSTADSTPQTDAGTPADTDAGTPADTDAGTPADTDAGTPADSTAQ